MTTSETTASLSNFLTAEDLQYLHQVSFVNRRRVRGRQTGLHHSRLRGGTTEFAEHRAYTPGDEVRRLDWRVVGRSDKLEIKLYDDPSMLDTVLLLDTSGSMKFADSTRSKFDYARSVIAWISKLVLGQRDPVGLLIAGDRAPQFLWPKTSTSHLVQILETLRSSQPSGRTQVAEQLRFLYKTLRHPARIMIVSDAFCDLNALQSEIKRLTGRRHRFDLLQTVAPEEVGFDYGQPLRFTNLEGSDFVDANPLDITESYLNAIQHHVESLRSESVV